MHHEQILKIFRLATMALLLWIVPSAASLGFYDRSGRLNVSAGVLSSFVTVTFSMLISCTLFPYGKFFSRSFLRKGSLTGIILLILF